MTKLAIIGVGEVGGCFARALQDRYHLALYDIKRDGPPVETANALGLELHGSAGPWLSDCDSVLVCTPGDACRAVADAVLPHILPQTNYIEMSTASPKDLRFVARYRPITDVAIMSSIQLMGASVPLLMAGERLAEAEALFAPLSAKINFVEAPAAAGDATALKLLRSVIIKGLECLAVEALTAAEEMGVRPQLSAVLTDLDEKPLDEFLEMMITTHAPHAARRGHEMEEAAAQLRDMGYDAMITTMLPERYAKTVAAKDLLPGAERVQAMTPSLAWLTEALKLVEQEEER